MSGKARWNANEADFWKCTRILPLCQIQTWQIMSEIANFLPVTSPMQQNNFQLAMAEKKKIVHDLLDFKAK